MSTNHSRAAEARDLLQKHKMLGRVSPPRLIASSKELGLGLAETIAYLAELMSGGQGQGPFPFTARALSNGAK